MVCLMLSSPSFEMMYLLKKIKSEKILICEKHFLKDDIQKTSNKS